MEEQHEVGSRTRRYRRFAGCLFLLAGIVAVAAVVLAASQGWPGQRAADPTRAVEAAPEPTGEPAATAGAPATSSEPAGAAQPLLSDSRIAFVDPQGRLGTVDADGSEERILTGDDAVLLFPAWSPDGSRLAAVGSSSDGPGVFAVEDSAGAALTPLYVNPEGAPIYLYWSPDGEAVSFIANHQDGFGLYLAPASGAGDSRLLATGAPFYWNWAEDGEQVLIHTGASGSDARLTFLDVAGGEAGDDLGSPGFFQVPGISAGGRYVAWAEVDEEGARWLVVKDEESGEDIRLPHRGSIAMSWSPGANSHLLAFVSPSGPEEQPLISHYGPLRVLDAASGEVEVLAQQVVLAFFWSPDGSRIAYITLSNVDEGVQAAADRRSQVAFSRRSKGAAQHDEVQLALWVVEVASGTTRRLLTFHPTAIYLTQFLPFFDQYALSHDVWAPQGNALVLPVAGSTPSEDEVYVVPVDEGRPFAVANGDIAFWGP